ncbi:MAG: hypothetical protein AB7I08_08765 [Thermoleophilia bacterium]
MSRRLLTAMAATALTVGLAGPIVAQADARPSANGPWVVKDLGHGKAVVAGHRTRSPNQSLGALITRWGPPARIGRPGGRGAYCYATWTRPRAKVLLGNFGLADPCSRRFGYIVEITTVGSSWRTDRGLEVGDGEDRARSLYPNLAVVADEYRVGDQLLLRPYKTVCLGDCVEQTISTSAVIGAASGGVIRRFLVPVGAAGE